MEANDLPVVDEADCEKSAVLLKEVATLVKEPNSLDFVIVVVRAYPRLYAQNEERGAEIERLEKRVTYLTAANEQWESDSKEVAMENNRLQARVKELEDEHGGV